MPARLGTKPWTLCAAFRTWLGGIPEFGYDTRSRYRPQRIPSKIPVSSSSCHVYSTVRSGDPSSPPHPVGLPSPRSTGSNQTRTSPGSLSVRIGWDLPVDLGDAGPRRLAGWGADFPGLESWETHTPFYPYVPRGGGSQL